MRLGRRMRRRRPGTMRQEMHPLSFGVWGLGFMVDGSWFRISRLDLGCGTLPATGQPVFLGKLPINTSRNSFPLFRSEADGFLWKHLLKTGQHAPVTAIRLRKKQNVKVNTHPWLFLSKTGLAAKHVKIKKSSAKWSPIRFYGGPSLSQTELDFG